ncbi:hypothetical protein QFZ50_001129 [Arthrobacter agilis]|nr:hypothetical protein [Arthrobacter agilis]
MLIEILGGIGRVALEVLLEIGCFWGRGDRREYRAYVDALPPGEKPLSKRKWRSSEQSNCAE